MGSAIRCSGTWGTSRGTPGAVPWPKIGWCPWPSGVCEEDVTCRGEPWRCHGGRIRVSRMGFTDLHYLPRPPLVSGGCHRPMLGWLTSPHDIAPCHYIHPVSGGCHRPMCCLEMAAPVAVHDPFGPAGGARGVAQGDAIPLVCRGGVLHRAPLLQEGLVVQGTDPGPCPGVLGVGDVHDKQPCS